VRVKKGRRTKEECLPMQVVIWDPDAIVEIEVEQDEKAKED
jgi:hypothetical protein